MKGCIGEGGGGHFRAMSSRLPSVQGVQLEVCNFTGFLVCNPFLSFFCRLYCVVCGSISQEVCTRKSSGVNEIAFR